MVLKFSDLCINSHQNSKFEFASLAVMLVQLLGTKMKLNSVTIRKPGLYNSLVQKNAVGVRNDPLLKVIALKFKS